MHNTLRLIRAVHEKKHVIRLKTSSACDFLIYPFEKLYRKRQICLLFDHQILFLLFWNFAIMSQNQKTQFISERFALWLQNLVLSHNVANWYFI